MEVLQSLQFTNCIYIFILLFLKKEGILNSGGLLCLAGAVKISCETKRKGSTCFN